MNLLDMYIKYTEDHESQEILHKWAIIWATGTILSGRCWTTVGYGDLKPNFYVMFLGPPATRKSGAIEVISDVMSFMFDADDLSLASDDFTYAALMKEFVNSEKSITIDDAAYNYMALALMVDEVDNFLDYKDRSIRTLLIAGFDGVKRRLKTTVHCGFAHVKNVSLSLLTASTDFNQGPTFTFFARKGFASRFIFIPVETKRFHKAKGFFSEELKEAIQRKLACLLNIVGLIPFSDEGEAAFDVWYQKQPLGVDKNVNRNMQHYAGRRPAYFRKLSLIMWAWDYLEDYTIKKEIEARHVEKALVLLEEMEEYACKAYGLSGRSNSAEDVGDLEKFFKDRSTEWVKRKDIFSMFKKEIEPNKIDEILGVLLRETQELSVRVVLNKEEYKWKKG